MARVDLGADAELSLKTLIMSGNILMRQNRIMGIADGIDPQDAVTKAQLDVVVVQDSRINDLDNDTSFETELTPNDNTGRVFTAGVERVRYLPTGETEWGSAGASFGLLARVTAAGEFSNTGGLGASEAFGAGANLNGKTNSLVMGSNAVVSNNNDTVIGPGAVGGGNSVAIGNNADANGLSAIDNNTVIGSFAGVLRSDNVVIGTSASGPEGSGVVVVGKSAVARGGNSMALGLASSTATGTTDSIAIGTAASVSGIAGIAIGRSAAAGANELVFGSETAPVIDGYVGEGATSTSPGTFTWHGTGGSGTNIDGSDFGHAGGQGTGTGLGGKYFVSTAPAGVTGTVLNPLVERFRITEDGETQWGSAGASFGLLAQVTAAGEFSDDGGLGGSEKFGTGATFVGTNNLTVFGANATSKNSNDVVIGTNAVGGGNTVTIGANAEGNGLSAFNHNVVIGADASIFRGTSVIIGSGASAPDGSSVIVIGRLASVTGNFGIALGAFTIAGISEFVVGSEAAPITNAYIGEGVTSTTPSAMVLHATGASGTDIAGADFTYAGSQGTGTGLGGDLLWRTAPAGASGSTPNALVTRLQITGAGAIGLYGVTPVVQVSKINDPSGGATVDAESRTAINAILDALEGIGISASV